MANLLRGAIAVLGSGKGELPEKAVLKVSLIVELAIDG